MSFFYNNIQNDEIASKFKSNEKVWAKTLSKLVAKLEG
jgi:predicted transcriptional regulator